MQYCQGTNCHEYKTKDRIRGTKGQKYYATRRRSKMYYGKGNFCSLNCQNDWWEIHGDNAVNHFGRLTEPKTVMCDNAWYKTYIYNYDYKNGNNYNHFMVNDLLGKKIPITEEQYNDQNYKHSSTTE
jgi:hypothetical protein